MLLEVEQTAAAADAYGKQEVAPEGADCLAEWELVAADALSELLEEPVAPDFPPL